MRSGFLLRRLAPWAKEHSSPEVSTHRSSDCVAVLTGKPWKTNEYSRKLPGLTPCKKTATWSVQGYLLLVVYKMLVIIHVDFDLWLAIWEQRLASWALAPFLGIADDRLIETLMFPHLVERTPTILAGKSLSSMWKCQISMSGILLDGNPESVRIWIRINIGILDDISRCSSNWCVPIPATGELL